MAGIRSLKNRLDRLERQAKKIPLETMQVYAELKHFDLTNSMGLMIRPLHGGERLGFAVKWSHLDGPKEVSDKLRLLAQKLDDVAAKK